MTATPLTPYPSPDREGDDMKDSQSQPVLPSNGQPEAEPSAAWDRQRACEAARTASMDYGQWVPQRWLDLFFAAYEAQK